MNSIQAIPTTYNGVQYRSRTEVRWCIFFERMGIEFVYEPEGFELSSGLRYLPDFYLPKVQSYAEVKPGIESVGKEFYKSFQLMNEGLSFDLILLPGLPDFRGYPAIVPAYDDPTYAWLSNVCLDIWDGNGYYHDENRFYQCFDEKSFTSSEDFSPKYRMAVEAARKAWFDTKIPAVGGKS